MFNFSFPIHTLAYIICFIPYVIFEVSIRSYKDRLKKEYRNKKESIHSSEEAELVSLLHFNKLQSIDITRIVVFIVLIIIMLSIADVRTFSFLAVTIGAIIITLRDYFVSLVSYLYVLANFDIGDDIKISSVLGTIVRIRPLTVSLAGKDSHGDFNGILHNIPNSKFITDVVERQEIKDNNYRCITLQALYANVLFKENFSTWLSNLKEYLDTNLTKRSLRDVGNYKSYVGLKYKLYYEYNDEGDIIISISFITRRKNAALRKEGIIEYIESTKGEIRDRK